MMLREMVCWLAMLTVAPIASAASGVSPLIDSEDAVTPGTIQPAEEAALKAYVHGRYSRIKASVDRDRAEARRYMTSEFIARYEAEFNPATALADFKQCADCEEFNIEIVRMEHEITADRQPVTEYSINVSQVEFITKPLNGTQAPRTMAVQVVWKPVDDPSPQHPPIEIERDEFLVRRRAIEM